MSIDLSGVTHIVSGKDSRGKLEFRDVNIHVENNHRVAILGKKANELEELVNIICGTVVPARGTVSITSEISWPIGESRFLISSSSLIANLRFMNRIYQSDEDEYRKRVTEVGDITEWNEPLSSCPRAVRWRFNFSLGVCLPFDIYIFHSTESPDKDYRESVYEIIDVLGRERGLLIPTIRSHVAERLCDRAYVVDGGKVTYYEDMEAALERFAQIEGPTVTPMEDDTVIDETRTEEDIFDII